MELRANAVHQEGMRFLVTAGSHSLTTDYPLNADETAIGPRPLELLLGSLASCAGGAMVALLRRAGQTVAGLRSIPRNDRRFARQVVSHRHDLVPHLLGGASPSMRPGVRPAHRPRSPGPQYPIASLVPQG